MMSNEEKHRILKSIFWDYDISLLPLNKIIEGDIKAIESYEFKLMMNRMLERLNWYELLDILGAGLLKDLITPEIIGRLRSKELKERYERIRRILHKEPLPFSGWDPEYRKRIKSTLLSDRWYRS